MTGYSRFRKATPLGHAFVEIHSVNRKTLEMNLGLPKEFLCFDIEIRKWIAEKIERGQITLRFVFETETPMSASLKQQKAFWEKMAKALGYDKGVVTFDFLLKQAQMSGSGAPLPPGMKKALEEMIQGALKELIQMKAQEGKALSRFFLATVRTMRKAMEKVEMLSKDSSKRYREKLLQRIEGLDIEKAAREVALFSEKVDITEEITRFRSHLDQFAAETSGRTLEFLLQEMQREVQTMASKTAETAVSQMTIALRSDLEKMRQQVQNVE